MAATFPRGPRANYLPAAGDDVTNEVATAWQTIRGLDIRALAVNCPNAANLRAEAQFKSIDSEYLAVCVARYRASFTDIPQGATAERQFMDSVNFGIILYLTRGTLYKTAWVKMSHEGRQRLEALVNGLDIEERTKQPRVMTLNRLAHIFPKLTCDLARESTVTLLNTAVHAECFYLRSPTFGAMIPRAGSFLSAANIQLLMQAFMRTQTLYTVLTTKGGLSVATIRRSIENTEKFTPLGAQSTTVLDTHRAEAFIQWELTTGLTGGQTIARYIAAEQDIRPGPLARITRMAQSWVDLIAARDGNDPATIMAAWTAMSAPM